MKDENILRKNVHNERYGTPAPYVSVCGRNLRNLDCFHVIFGMSVIDFDSVMLAFDFLFNYIHVTGSDYPTICLNSWEFFHHVVHNLPRSAKSLSIISIIKTLSVDLKVAEKKFYSLRDSEVPTVNLVVLEKYVPF